MKKLLALVLALVMTLSLCITSNAAFAGEEYDYDEAVEVMAAVGVFQGDENGKFNGKAELTREQAAKLIAYLDLGEKVAEALPAVKVFNDVDASRWSAKYVAYCADAGYINGVGNGNFDPAGKLTGYAFGKMLLCVLGYDAAIESFTGANWTIKVAKLMQSNDIAKGVDASAAAALTREQAAQYCFNALKADMVEYADKGTSIKVNGAEIVTSAKAANKVTSSNTQVADNNYLQLGEKLYTKLFYKKADSDDLGHPAHTWYFGINNKDDDAVGTYADAADFTVVAAKAYASLDALYLDKVDKKYNKNTIEDLGAKLQLNGATYTKGTGVKAGDVVEYYLSDVGVVTDVVVSQYSIAKIDKVDTKLTKQDKEDDVTAKITLKLGDTTKFTALKDTKFAGFDAATYVEGAYVLYIDKSSEIIASELADSVEGKVTATKGDKAAIDGVYYDDVQNTKSTVNAEGTFYLNKAGQIMYADAKNTKSDNYAYIYAWKADLDKVNDEGVKTNTLTAYVVLADGTKASYKVDATYASSAWKWDGTAAASLGAIDINNPTVVAYSINSDGELVYETAKDYAVTNPSSAVTVDKTAVAMGTANSKSARATSDTTFVFVDRSDASKVSVKVATGYKNVSLSTANVKGAYADKNGYVSIAFVSVANGNLTSDATYAVVLDANAEYSKVDNKEYWAYSVVVNGEETTLTCKDSNKFSNVAKGDIFEIVMDGDYVKTATEKSVYTVNGVTADYIDAATLGYANLGKETTYTVTVELKADNSVDTVSVAEGGTADTEETTKVFFDKDGSDVKTLFVFKYVK